ncbi:hypothetical protein Tco_0161489 [Tanacetum coccineum]
MDEVCSVCCFGDGDSFAYDPNPNSFNDSPNFSDYPPQPQYQTYSCELCGNDAHYGYDCPPQVPFVYNQDPCFNQNFDNNNFPQTSSSFPQQYLCCENYRGPHETKVSSQYWKPPIFYDDDDEESSIPLRDIISELPLVKDLNLTPSESEDLSDNESECDVPVCDDSSPNFTTFFNPLFDSNHDFTSSNDESFYEEDVPKENFKIYSNPLFEFDEEIISNLIEFLLNRDTSMVSSPKIDSLLEEFPGELAHIDSIPPGIDEAEFDPEDDIRLVEKLLYDNSSPRPSKELNSEIPDAIIESFSPSHILVKDKLLNDDSISLHEYESFHVDFYNVPSSPRPPKKPPDDDVYFDIEPDTRVLTTKVVDDIFDNSTRELYVHVPNVLPTLPTLYPVFDTLLPFSSENEDKVFNPRILISKEEKSPHL